MKWQWSTGAIAVFLQTAAGVSVLPGSCCSRPCCWRCVLCWAHSWKPRDTPGLDTEGSPSAPPSQASPDCLRLTQSLHLSSLFHSDGYILYISIHEHFIWPHTWLGGNMCVCVLCQIWGANDTSPESILSHLQYHYQCFWSETNEVHVIMSWAYLRVRAAVCKQPAWVGRCFPVRSSPSLVSSVGISLTAWWAAGLTQHLNCSQMLLLLSMSSQHWLKRNTRKIHMQVIAKLS